MGGGSGDDGVAGRFRFDVVVDDGISLVQLEVGGGTVDVVVLPVALPVACFRVPAAIFAGHVNLRPAL